jgi:glycosyltransferase involved in cell wall biosynthesis
MNPETAIRLFSLASQLIFIGGPAHFDDIALFTFPFLRSSRYILDFRCPLSLELSWLSSRVLSKSVSIIERRAVNKAKGVTAPNEHMAALAKKLGAQETFVIPNYPLHAFSKITPIPNITETVDLPPDSEVVFFSGRSRLFEIYGFDMLLKAWRILEKERDNAHLVIASLAPSKQWVAQLKKQYKISRIKFLGWIDKQQLASWIQRAAVCLAPRTPGFPTHLYNDKDSCKISEYAAFSKPIVAAGYAPSEQYYLTFQTPTAFAEGIRKALRGELPLAVPHFWEENQKRLFEIYASL